MADPKDDGTKDRDDGRYTWSEDGDIEVVEVGTGETINLDELEGDDDTADTEQDGT